MAYINALRVRTSRFGSETTREPENTTRTTDQLAFAIHPPKSTPSVSSSISSLDFDRDTQRFKNLLTSFFPSICFTSVRASAASFPQIFAPRNLVTAQPSPQEIQPSFLQHREHLKSHFLKISPVKIRLQLETLDRRLLHSLYI